MCGIVGYLGKNNALPALIDGLKRLEYRGYDSSGVALRLAEEIECVKAVGKIADLEKKLGKKSRSANLGIAHTRWATHGEANEVNAHPHSGCSGKIWLAHNGIIENHKILKEELRARGHVFKSQTDTEVIAHLIEDTRENDPLIAMREALKKTKGAYAIVFIHRDFPEKIMAAKMGSPLVIGLGNEETIIASDISAIISRARKVIYLDDGEAAEIGKNGLKIFDASGNEIFKEPRKIDWDQGQAEKEGFPHFMLKEIFEQPNAILDSLRGRVDYEKGEAIFEEMGVFTETARSARKIAIAACGTAMHAGLIGEYMFEELASFSSKVDYASEFRYRTPVIGEDTILLAISQSGETADTLAALREGKRKGAATLGVVNVLDSTIAREVDICVHNRIGIEMSVASTKAFTSQVAIMALLAVYFGRQREMTFADAKSVLDELLLIPDKIKKILELSEEIKKIAEKHINAENFLYLGRKYNVPTALEGALKLKELSYIHAEGMPSGEMKHGSIALIDDNFPTMFICPKDSVYEKNISNMEEIRCRGGKIIAIATEGDEKIKSVAQDIIYVPKTTEPLGPILAVIPLQLFAYHMAVLKGLDVDKPRNLAKSVTVE